MRRNFDVPLGLDQSDALHNIHRQNLKNVSNSGPGGGRHTAKADLDRSKDLQTPFSWAQALAPSGTPAMVLGAGQQRDSGSVPLIPPGPSSPHDSQAPALRNDGANLSNGSVPISQQAGSSGQSLPAAPEPMTYTLHGTAEPLAIPDLSDLPLDLPDMFGELDVPSLEDLVQDIGAAEAELMATKGLPTWLKVRDAGAGGSAGGTPSMNLLRAQTLPAPSALPPPPPQQPSHQPQIHTANNATRIHLHVRRNSSTVARQGSLPDGTNNMPVAATVSHGSDGSAGSGSLGGNRKRKGTIKTVAEEQQQQQQASIPESPALAVSSGLTAAVSDFSLDFSRPPLPKRIEVDFILDDDALLDRVGNQTSAFAGLSPFSLSGAPETTYKAGKISAELSPALSLPNRHWLSPAAAIHAVHASRPGDEDVIKWLMHGY